MDEKYLALNIGKPVACGGFGSSYEPVWNGKSGRGKREKSAL